jgi:hypothetical protein
MWIAGIAAVLVIGVGVNLTIGWEARALAAMAAARVSPESKMAARAVRHLGVTADSGLATAAGIDGRCEAKAARARVR